MGKIISESSIVSYSRISPLHGGEKKNTRVGLIFRAVVFCVCDH